MTQNDALCEIEKWKRKTQANENFIREKRSEPETGTPHLHHHKAEYSLVAFTEKIVLERLYLPRERKTKNGGTILYTDTGGSK